MTAQIIALRPSHDPRFGIIHVMGSAEEGFEIGHESSSGNSWGWFSGPYETGGAAIAAAHALNRAELLGRSEISICAAALADGRCE